MKNYQNQLDRFGNIAKKLVDEHSADLFQRCRVVTNGRHQVMNDAFYNHLDVLGKQLDEHAQSFIGATKLDKNEELKTDIWSMCRKYLDQFVKRNQPDE